MPLYQHWVRGIPSPRDYQKYRVEAESSEAAVPLILGAFAKQFPKAEALLGNGMPTEIDQTTDRRVDHEDDDPHILKEQLDVPSLK